MNKLLKKTVKWSSITAGVLFFLLVISSIVLTSPGLFMNHSHQYRTITVYTDFPNDSRTDSMMLEIFTRLDAVPVYNADRKMNLVLCSTQDKFSFFSGFTLRDQRIMGFCLLGNAYINMEFINQLGSKTGGRPKYHTRAGSVVHVATHELIHQYFGDAYGEISSRLLPVWKLEGYIEYGVNQFVAPLDSGYTIAERIEIYLDDSQWNSTSAVHRNHFVWGLMMEYLINIKNMNYREVMEEDISFNIVYREMMAWRNSL